ncbi:MAG: hypothetical protein CM15mV28_0460 [Thaumasvirus sp.]|nr:MAG: hypothetical protein CM15mV28_0460 [Thaumasvirus sp.]
MANRIQLRRGGAQEWANSNPTLAQGELGIELDTVVLRSVTVYLHGIP